MRWPCENTARWNAGVGIKHRHVLFHTGIQPGIGSQVFKLGVLAFIGMDTDKHLERNNSPREPVGSFGEFAVTMTVFDTVHNYRGRIVRCLVTIHVNGVQFLERVVGKEIHFIQIHH